MLADRADVVLDGIVGIGGAAACAPSRGAGCSPRARRGSGRRGRRAQRCRRRHRRPGAGTTSRPTSRVTLRCAQARRVPSTRAPRAPVRGPRGRHRPRPLALPAGPGRRCSTPTTSPRCCRPGAGRPTSTRAGSSGSRRAARTHTGAAVLAVAGARGAGPQGMVRFCGRPRSRTRRAAHPEAVVDRATDSDPRSTGRVQAWVVGPGGGTDDAGAPTSSRAVLDAGLPVARRRRRPGRCSGRSADLAARRPAHRGHRAVTPHAGELARLLAAGRDRVEAPRPPRARAAERFGATVLLKGSTTLVADPDRGARVHPAATRLARDRRLRRRARRGRGRAARRRARLGARRGVGRRVAARRRRRSALASAGAPDPGRGRRAPTRCPSSVAELLGGGGGQTRPA